MPQFVAIRIALTRTRK